MKLVKVLHLAMTAYVSYCCVILSDGTQAYQLILDMSGVSEHYDLSDSYQPFLSMALCCSVADIDSTAAQQPGAGTRHSRIDQQCYAETEVHGV